MSRKQLSTGSFLQRKRGAYLLLIFLLAGTTGLRAQLGSASLTGPGIAFSTDYLDPGHYIRPLDSGSTQATTKQQRYNFGFNCVLSKHVDSVAKKMQVWTLSGTGSYTRLTNDHYAYGVFPEKLYGAQLSLQYLGNLQGHWSITAMLSGGSYTDTTNFYSEALFFSGYLIFIHRSANFTYGIGAMLTNTFGSAKILPAVFVKWKSNRRLRIDLRLPEKAGLTWIANEKSDPGLLFRLRGASYFLYDYLKDKQMMGYSESSLNLEYTRHIGKIDFVAAAGTTLSTGATFQQQQ